jgi:hypothetical protein
VLSSVAASLSSVAAEFECKGFISLTVKRWSFGKNGFKGFM